MHASKLETGEESEPTDRVILTVRESVTKCWSGRIIKACFGGHHPFGISLEAAIKRQRQLPRPFTDGLDDEIIDQAAHLGARHAAASILPGHLE
jgi:hypothetical protein